MDGYQVQFGALSAVADQIGVINQDVIAKLNDLAARVDAVAPNWDSDAKQEWSVVRVKWQEQMSKMSQMLNAMQTFVGDANTSMMTTEQRNTGLFAGG